jgi:hypothetical protein
VEVGRTNIVNYSSWLHTRNSWEEINRVQGPVVADMVTSLFRVRGVRDVFVWPYKVSVHMDSMSHTRGPWNEEIDRIVRFAFRRIAGQGQPSRKVVIHEDHQATRREYHTNFEVSKSRIQDFKRPLADWTEGYLKEIGPEGASLVRKLMALPGVVEIWMRPYEVDVEIGKVFNWAEHYGNESLERMIEEVFSSVFGSDVFFAQK